MADRENLTTRRGNFDHPPASQAARETTASLEARRSAITNSLREIQEEIGRERTLWQQRRHREDSTSSPPPWAWTARSGRQAPPRPRHRNNAAHQRTRQLGHGQTMRLNRESSHRSEISPERQRLLDTLTGSSLDATSTDAELAQAHEDRRPLLVRPIDPPCPVNNSSAASARDASERRPKRRKLNQIDSDFLQGKSYMLQRYGYRGHVTPARLKMELVSCDGGAAPLLFEQKREKSHGAENMLYDDATVYCTTSSHCSVVLRHEGGIQVDISKLVVTAPQNGYSDPVREGMIFFSLKNDAAFQRTSMYKIIHFPSCRFAKCFPSSQQKSNSDDDVGESTMHHAPVIPVQSTDPDSSLTMQVLEPEHHIGWTWGRSDQDGGGAAEPYSDEDGNHSDISSNSDRQSDRLAVAEWDQNVGDDPPRPNHLLSARLDEFISRGILSDFDSDGEDTASTGASTPREQIPASSQDINSVIERTTIQTDQLHVRSDTRQQDFEFVFTPRRDPVDVRAVDEPQFLQPYARFFLRRGDHNMVIRFDPPISTRYVLLKFWAPKPNNNIDIERVQCFGYVGGPRYFDACQFV